MTDPKNKKKKKPSQDKGGGDDPITKEDFLRVLDRAIEPQKSPDQENEGQDD